MSIARTVRAAHRENPMAKFLCLQRSIPTENPAKPSPAEMQEMYTKFGEWTERFKDQLIDLGGKLGAGTVASAEPVDGDGPFIEVKELVGGYMIVEAESLAAAIEVASACPGLVRPGSGCEVIEIQSS
ncbi:MAG: YciI family protein [Myxococcota bacterium]